MLVTEKYIVEGVQLEIEKLEDILEEVNCSVGIPADIKSDICNSICGVQARLYELKKNIEQK